MKLAFSERVKEVREALGINKAEAARLLNMSKMGYGRYESGERTPSYQMIDFIARKFGVSSAYLLGETEEMTMDYVYIEREDDPGFYEMILETKNDLSFRERMMAYYYRIKKEMQEDRGTGDTQ